MKRSLVISLWVALGSGCGSEAPGSGSEAPTREAPAAAAAEVAPAVEFMAALEELCGQAFEGRVVESVPPDPSFDTERLIMHVRECGPDEIRIPFYVGDDRSRTWVISRTGTGLRLKHDHRHEDGSEDEVTQYGGDTQEAGTAEVQAFHADPFTAELVPTAATNVWTLEVRSDGVFAYDLRREGSDRRFRAEFDLSRAVETPLPPWGATN